MREPHPLASFVAPMIVDSRDLPDRATLQADVCVVGAGAAGITLALELAGGPLRVVLLEGGGIGPEAGARGIYQVVGGAPVPRLCTDPSRAWYFGGNTNHWVGLCRPFEDADFEPRDWIPHSGWPIRRGELQPYYDRAQAVCGLGALRWYDLAACRPHLRHQPLDVDASALSSEISQACPVGSFADLHRERIEAAQNLRVFLHGRALRLTANRTGDRIEALEALDAGERRLRVEAGAFVLATGGIENVRLLLASRQAGALRLANDGDLIGRFFAEHWHVDIPVTYAGPHDLTFYGQLQSVGDVRVWGQLALSDDLRRRERLLGLSFWFRPLGTGAAGAGLLGRAMAFTGERARSKSLLADVKLALREPAEAAAHVVRRVRQRAGGKPRGYFMRVQLEQAPDPDNRVRLSPSSDCRESPTVDLALRLSEEDRRSHLESLRIAAALLGLDGRRLARRLALRLDAGRMGFFSHHAGTTRMSADPAHGVVDADCRVHGIENLFVCGSSVFPTLGTTPPTLTIVALALRLADRLRAAEEISAV